MTNHVHLLVSAEQSEATGVMMKALGQRYVQYINRTYKRTGTLWEGRYKSCPIQAESYLLSCQRYIELNPIRANMVEHPAEYQWSSYRSNAQGEPSDLIKPHIIYKQLGLNQEARQAAYRELFRCQLNPKLLDEIRQSTNGNYVLGDTRFAEKIAKAVGRRVLRGKAGRPKNEENIK